MIDWTSYWLNTGKNSQNAIDYNNTIIDDSVKITTKENINEATKELLFN